MNFECILSHGATLPQRNNPTDSGMDITIKGYRYIIENGHIGSEVWFDEENHDHAGYVFIRPKERILAMSGIKIAIPSCEEENYVFEVQVRPRSGLALKQGISIVNSPGTIDQDYRGDIGVILVNHGDDNVYFKDGDKIAQLVINKVFVGEKLVIVSDFSTKTNRDEKGYGSSGK